MTASPQVMRDRLLEAIDGQNNISDMVVVLEVISYLENYPITKEALEETRLGKLINDVRKKTKNEDLARRAKKLLRTWQKLLEPGMGDGVSKGPNTASWSSYGGARPYISSPSVPLALVKPGPELKNRNDFNNCSPTVEKQSSRKRKGEGTEKEFVPAKICKTSSMIGSSNDVFIDACAHQPFVLEISESLDSERLNKIPVNAVKPHANVARCTKPLSTSALLKASVLQQQARQKQAASGGRHQATKSRGSLHKSQTPKQNAGRCGTVDLSELEVSPQDFNISAQGLNTDRSKSVDVDSESWLHPTPFHVSAASSCSDVIRSTNEGFSYKTGTKKRQKCVANDHCFSLVGQDIEDSSKPVRLKDRTLTFDPVTRQIKTFFHKDSPQVDSLNPAQRCEIQSSEPLKQNQNPVPPSPFQQTDWKELSRSEIIQSYLSQQSSMLTSSGARTFGAHFFMTEFLKKEEHKSTGAKTTHELVSLSPHGDLPGVNREVSGNDLSRLHTQPWCGVNGCYDTKGDWYDWTKCISLEPHGDESKLNLLPYVCLD
ncbi:mediator of RNA polymerase II transcription subunit 26 [Gouania willdenowi]|uniref:Mediator of RNA polymerase II transcription subunit 26 n=1 Tax=Gouania willdenowi TaxID=441366 RepID=A0A8C5FYX0_GOUWI|nr:mediator of RNA polymerase II transcription subunit 26 [Gouania willdenowi]